jgi:hypothetical protein
MYARARAHTHTTTTTTTIIIVIIIIIIIIMATPSSCYNPHGATIQKQGIQILMMSICCLT